MTTDNKIATLQKLVELARSQRSQAEGRKAQLEEERKRIRAEMEQFGVTPESLPDEIKRLEQELEACLAEAEKAIPEDMLAL